MIEAESVQEFSDRITAQSVADIWLLDANVPVAAWLETAIRVKRNWLGIKILFFSMLKSETYVNQLMEIGVDGFVSKKAPFAELHAALFNLMKKNPANPIETYNLSARSY